MTLTQHLAITAAAATVLAPLWSAEEILLFAAGSVLIDVDHYLFYAVRCRRFDVRGMFRYFDEVEKIEKSIPYLGLCLFHTLDFFLLVAILAGYYPLLLSLLVGLIFHFVIDLIDLIRKEVPFIRAFFLVEHLVRRRGAGYPYF